MTGEPDHGFVQFADCAARWRRRGHFVISPAEIDVLLGYGPSDPLDRRSALRWDYPIIEVCDGIVLLPGWENSIGARAELRFALKHDKRIYLGNGRRLTIEQAYDLLGEKRPVESSVLKSAA